MPRKAQRPIDVKALPWSHIGKDALDAAIYAAMADLCRWAKPLF